MATFAELFDASEAATPAAPGQAKTPTPAKIAKVPGAADADSHRLLAQELANAQAKLGNNDPRVADDIAALKREISRTPGTPALIPPPVITSAPAQAAAASSPAAPKSFC